MRRATNLLLAVVLTLQISLIARGQTTPTTQPHWWNQPSRPPRPSSQAEAKKLPLIRVEGNRFVDSQGQTVLFRGVSISDPDKIDGQGHWNREHFEHVKEFGATLVRIPVHPVAWRERTPEKY